MASKTYGKAPRGTALGWIGLWATLWWAVSGLFCALVVWRASRSNYVIHNHGSQSFYSPVYWIDATAHVYENSRVLVGVSVVIMVVWMIGALVWSRELQAKSIKYRVALRDLLLSIRK